MSPVRALALAHSLHASELSTVIEVCSILTRGRPWKSVPIRTPLPNVRLVAEALKDHDSEVGYLFIVTRIASASNIKSSESLRLHGS